MSFRTNSTMDNIFGVSSGQELIADLEVPAIPTKIGILHSAQNPSKHFDISNTSEHLHDLHQSKIAELSDFFQTKEPSAEKSIQNLIMDTAANMTSYGFVKNAMDMGEGIEKGIKDLEIKDQSSMEDIICKTVSVASGLLADTLSTGVITAGIPLLMTESIAFPPLAATIPVVAEALPQAYANAQEFAEFVRKKAEDDCHRLFSVH